MIQKLAWVPPVAASAAGGAALAVLTPSILPRTEGDQKMLSGGGAVMGALGGATALGALRAGRSLTGLLFPSARSTMARLHQPARHALTGAALVVPAGIIATHWGPDKGTPPAAPAYKPPAGADVIESVDEQRRLKPKPGTSGVGRETLDRQGLRFLDTVTPGLGQAPVRVYSGLETKATARERVAFAIARMKELGAFERSRIIVAQPSGSGFVNQVPIQAAEIMADGDVASVALQYNNTRSVSKESVTKVGPAADQHRMLLEAIHAEVQKMPANKRPKVYQFGESLGGHTAQNAVTKDGSNGLEKLGIRRALWIGTPGFSTWDSKIPPDKAVRIEGREKLYATQADDIPDSARVVELVNSNDPVNKLDPWTAVRRPDWLEGDAPKGVKDDQVWVPGITLLQTAVDMKTSIDRLHPGKFKSTDHDYRTSHAKAVQLAFDFPDMSARQLDRMTSRLQQMERDYFSTHPAA